MLIRTLLFLDFLYHLSHSDGLMKTYNVAVFWMMSATVQVEAKSLEDAMELALDGDVPADGEYMNDSLQVDEHWSKEANKE
jgi:hypothetical protein